MPAKRKYENKKTALVQFRVTLATKERWLEEAAKARLSLASWITAMCDAKFLKPIQEAKEAIQDVDFGDITMVEATRPPVTVPILQLHRPVIAPTVYVCPVCQSEFCPGCQPIKTR